MLLKVEEKRRKDIVFFRWDKRFFIRSIRDVLMDNINGKKNTLYGSAQIKSGGLIKAATLR